MNETNFKGNCWLKIKSTLNLTTSFKTCYNKYINILTSAKPAPRYALNPMSPSSTKEYTRLFKSSTNQFVTPYNVEDVYLYEVTGANEMVNQQQAVHWDNRILYHGTTLEGAAGILHQGFRDSPSGFFGSGVYMTESSGVAVNYSYMRNKAYNVPKKNVKYVFANEVLNSYQLRLFTFQLYRPHLVLFNLPFAKYSDFRSKIPTMNDYWRDRMGRLVRSTPLQYLEHDNEFVASHVLVKPRFLFVINTGE